MVDGDGNVAVLDIENCTVDISGLNAAGQMVGKQGTGLEIIEGGNVTTRGANLTIKGHIDGVLIENASTLDLNAFAPETQSTIVSDANINGLALIESSFILNDQSEATVSNNTESGVFLSLIQLFACDVGVQFNITNSGVDFEIEGELLNDGKVCALQIAAP